MANQEPAPDQLSQEQLRHKQGFEYIFSEFLGTDDEEFVAEMDDYDEQLGYLYGRLLEQGYDPEEVLSAAKLTEATDEV